MIEKSKFTDLTVVHEMRSSRKNATKPRRGSRFERHRIARLMSVQALYEANHNNLSPSKVMTTFLEYRFKNHGHPIAPDRELFIHLLKTLEDRADQIRDILEGIIVGTWTLESLDMVLKSVLMVGISELLNPYKGATTGLIISEYVEVAKGFFDEKQAGYVNKALDTVAKGL